MKADLEDVHERWKERMREEGRLKDPKTDHYLMFIATQNKIRRDILEFICEKKKNFNEIKKNFDTNDFQIKYHLDILENALFLEKIEDKGDKYYLLTPRGLLFVLYIMKVEFASNSNG